MRDSIILRGLRARAHHGVYEHERRDGQEFVVDVDVQLSLGDSDDLADTIHYGELAEQVVAAVEGDPVDLIESVAERVARVVLSHARAEFVTVEVHKPQAPISVLFDDVSVRVHRAQDRAGRRRRVVIALGSNLGDRAGTIAAAVRDLGDLPVTRLVAASGLVQTPALKPDGVDRDAPSYLNAVVLADTELQPRQLLALLQLIERAHGRERHERWGDRTLDLDIVAFGDLELSDGDLTVPHPRAHERDFVLWPWLQVDPDAELPGHGPIAQLLGAVPDAYPAEPLR